MVSLLALETLHQARISHLLALKERVFDNAFASEEAVPAILFPEVPGLLRVRLVWASNDLRLGRHPAIQDIIERRNPRRNFGPWELVRGRGGHIRVAITLGILVIFVFSILALSFGSARNKV